MKSADLIKSNGTQKMVLNGHTRYNNIMFNILANYYKLALTACNAFIILVGTSSPLLSAHENNHNRYHYNIYICDG